MTVLHQSLGCICACVTPKRSGRLVPGRLRRSRSAAGGPIARKDLLYRLLRKCYEEADVSPAEVEYLEAFAIGLPECDRMEMEAVDAALCRPGRAAPLLVGSVASNMGYSEAVSTLAALVKVCLAYHKGWPARGLHCTTPLAVDGVREGRIRVHAAPAAVDARPPLQYKYAAINSLSYSGNNGHVLLQGYYKEKIAGRYSSLPYLVSISGRLETSVQHVIEELRSSPLDPEAIALLHNIHEKPTVGHMGRGYVILSPAQEEGSLPNVLAESYQYYPDLRRPLCFVYSGMGSQWATMGTELLRLPIFAAAIERCHQVLEPRGVNLMRILTDSDSSIFDNILHSFVGIAAVQIGLTDILRELGLKPDYIIGHSVGELGCAYADECFTLEETILAAYSRGLVSVETPFVRGAMAAVGLGQKAVSSMSIFYYLVISFISKLLILCRCEISAPDVAIACHNSSDSCTISGPAESLRAFVTDLRARSIFAKEVPCSNIAYHSQYIAAAGPALLQHLSAIIIEPKRRSERWLSTSVPQDNWSKPAAIFSSAEYHTNNLLRPVLFEETARLLPRDAMLVEIAPHGLLQAILRRSMPTTCVNIPLTRRAHSEPITFLLEAIGKIYIGGHQPRLAVLYPAIEFPVSTGTPLLSHLMEWMHDEKGERTCELSESRWSSPPINIRNPRVVTTLVPLGCRVPTVQSLHRVDSVSLVCYVSRDFIGTEFYRCASDNALTLHSLSSGREHLAFILSARFLTLVHYSVAADDIALHLILSLARLSGDGCTSPIAYCIIDKGGAVRPAELLGTYWRRSENGSTIAEGVVERYLTQLGAPFKAGGFRTVRAWVASGVGGLSGWARKGRRHKRARRKKTQCVNVSLRQRVLCTGAGHSFGVGDLTELDLMQHATSFLYYRLQFSDSSFKQPLARYTPAIRIWSYERKFVISLHDEGYQHLVDRCVYGVPRFSMAGLLLLVWETYAMAHAKPLDEFGVEFHGVKLVGDDPQVYEDRPLRLYVAIQRGCGYFEVKNENLLLACGVIMKKNIPMFAPNETSIDLVDDKVLQLNGNDVYRLLEERGYSLRNKFRTIARANLEMNEAEFVWNTDWMTFLDGVLQLCVLRRPHDGVSRPVSLLFLGIDPEAYSKPDLVRAQLEPHQFTCKGITLKEIRFEDRPWPAAAADLMLNSLVFMPHFPNDEISVDEAVHMHLQIVADNIENVTIVQQDDNTLLLQEPIRKAIQNLRTARYSQRFDFVPGSKNILNPHLLIVHEPNSQILNALPAGSFALCVNSVSVRVDWEKLDCVLVSCARTTAGEIQLIRRRVSLEHASSVLLVSFDECMQILKNGIRAEDLKRPLIVSELSAASEELPDLVKASTRCDVCLCLTDYKTLSETSIIMQSRKQLKINIFKNEMWGGLYLVPPQMTSAVASGECDLRLRGAGAELEWRPEPPLASVSTPVQVHFAAVSEYDAFVATGRAPAYDEAAAPHEYGLCFSGITGNGEHVMGVSPRALGTLVAPDAALLWPVPAHWSLADAATVPLAYAAVYYCVAIRNNIQGGTVWLIHDAASALGQAAIAIGLSLECTVFAVVRNRGEKRLLSFLFTELPHENILCSHAGAFENSVLSITRGRGVDLAFGSMCGEVREATFRCTGRLGILCDVSDDTISKQDESLGMHFLSTERMYMTLRPANLIRAPENMRRTLQLMIAAGLARGHVRPVTRVVLPAVEVGRAMQLITSERLLGCMVLSVNDLKKHVTTTLNYWNSEALKKAVTIWCGEASIWSGSLLVDALVRSGQRSILLQRNEDSANAYDAAYLDFKMKQWRRTGADVQVLWCSEVNARKQLDAIRVATRGQARMLLMVESEGAAYGKKLVHLRKLAAEVYPELEFLVALTTRPDVALNWELTKDVSGELNTSLMLHAPDLLKLKEWTAEPCYWNAVIDALNTAFRIGGGVMLLTATLAQEEKDFHDNSNELEEQARARGLATLFPRIESDELRTAAELTIMPTFVHNGTELDFCNSFTERGRTTRGATCPMDDSLRDRLGIRVTGCNMGWVHFTYPTWKRPGEVGELWFKT
ncbi:Fatty acid synthase [Eumeta japonica]|uniref:Fatty acid synthase n=1 Tax=Eumeta variegata TaxID=151549 RepID=A0A4C2A7G3_EUMVA|nr:Fatty acid synthase [Eumeta japonica]